MPHFRQIRHMRVAVGQHRTTFLQQLHQFERRAFARIIDVFFVRHPEQTDAGAFNRLGLFVQKLGQPTDQFMIATFVCIAGSGTYMRTLAEVIARACGTTGLAYHIHRTHIGLYQPLPLIGGFWRKRLK